MTKVRLDWAAQIPALQQAKKVQLSEAAFLRGAEELLKRREIKHHASIKQALGITTSDYAYIADFVRRLIYKHVDDLSWVVQTIGRVGLSNLDLTVEFNGSADISGPLSEADTGERTVLKWTKYEIELKKYIGRFLVTDAARARGRSNIQAVTTLKAIAEELTRKKERNAIDELYAGAGNSGAATAAWNTSSATIEADINTAIGTILDSADSLNLKRLGIVLLVPAKVWTFLTAQQATLNLSVLDHFKKTLNSFEVIPTKYWDATASIGIQNDALVYVPGAGTAIHGFSKNAPFPLTERVRVPGVGFEYYVQQWFETVVTPDSKSTTTSGRIYKITGVV